MASKTRLALTAFLSLPALLVSIASATAEVTNCHWNERWLVAIQEYSDAPGSRIAVNKLSAPHSGACAFNTSDAAAVIGQPGEALWFGELSGDFLVLKRSTGPQGDLVVYDLGKMAIVIDAPADEYAIENGKMTYWERAGQGNAGNCPQFAEHQQNGFGSAIARKKVFDPVNRTTVSTGEARCDATQ